MFSEIIAAMAATVISAGSAAAFAAAKRAGETREIIVHLQTQMQSIEDRMSSTLEANNAIAISNEHKICQLCDRVQRMDNDFRQHLINLSNHV